jgi:hypothetical protein
MSWQTDITTIIRHLLNDLDSSSFSYADDRIQKTILVAAHLISTETELDYNYTIDISDTSLSPDPTTQNPKDNNFITLLSLKTSCIILGSEIRTESGNAIAIKDGPSSIDLRGVTATLTALYKDLCMKYDKALLDYKSGNSIAGQAILGPYSPGSDYMSRTHTGGDQRGNYFRY